MSDVVLLCMSKKPGEHEPWKRSAARQLLRVCETSLTDAGIATDFIDLRDHEIPFFDGRPIGSYGPVVDDLAARLRHARLVLFGFPAYWGGLNGYGKNFLDVLGGAVYDAEDRETPLTGTFVSAVVVGGTQGDSGVGLAAFRHVMAEMGATPLPDAVALDNPRSHPAIKDVVTRCYRLPRTLMERSGLADARGRALRDPASVATRVTGTSAAPTKENSHA